MSKVPPGGRCDSGEGSADGLGDGAGAGEPSDSADGTPSGRDGDDGLVGMGLLKRESRALILSRIDSHRCFGIAEEAIARRR